MSAFSVKLEKRVKSGETLNSWWYISASTNLSVLRKSMTSVFTVIYIQEHEQRWSDRWWNPPLTVSHINDESHTIHAVKQLAYNVPSLNSTYESR